MAFYNHVQVTIANGAQASSSADIQGYVLCGIIIPAAFTGTAITFQLGDDAGNFYDIYDSTDSQLSMTVTQGRAYLLNAGDFVGVRYLKIKSGSAEGAERTVTLITRLV